MLNNLFLTTACATVFVGTLYPLALEALTGGQDKISVGAPFFNMTFWPLFVPLLIAMPFGPLMAWKRGDLPGVTQRLFGAFALALVGIALTFVAAGGGPVLAPFGIGLALFIVGGAVTDLIDRTGLGRVPLGVAYRRAAGLPRSAWGGALAHLGIGITMFGIVCESSWAVERIAALKPNETISLRGYDLTFQGLLQRQGPNYTEQVGSFVVSSGGAEIGRLQPSKRSFAARGSATSEAALLTRGASQLYLSLGDAGADGSVTVRAYHKPLVLLIWIGALVMFAGGALSLSDRRLRVGAPKPAQPKAAALRVEAAE